MENTFTHEREVNFGVRQWKQYQHILWLLLHLLPKMLRGNSQNQRPEFAVAAACTEI